MQYTPKEFDVEIRTDVPKVGLNKLPSANDSSSCFALFGNRSYFPLRGVTWDEFDAVAEFEAECMSDIASSSDLEATLNEIDEWIYNDPDWSGLDLGVAGAVYALSAAGCLCGSSCNGGAFGGFHSESHPLVVFVATDKKLDLLRMTAEEVGAGLTRSNGVLLLYADKIEKMMVFGHALKRLVDP